MTPAALSSRIRVVLVHSRNPMNIGAAARAMSNFGFENLRVVNPYSVAFREARSAVGASQILKRAEEYTKLPDAIADCELVVGTTAAKDRELLQPLVLLEQAKPLMERQSGGIALLFGSERRGLSNADLSYCHWLLRIPTAEGQPSMNLGQAVAVCLYALSRPPVSLSEPEQKPSATARELDLISDFLAEALYEHGYMNAEAKSSTTEKVRRLVRRLSLSTADAQLLLGMLRQLTRQ